MIAATPCFHMDRLDRPASGAYRRRDVTERPRALLAIEDDLTRRAVHTALVADGWDVVHARAASDLMKLLYATAKLDRRGYQLIVCGLRASERSELDVLGDVLHIGGVAPVLFLTRLLDDATRAAARGLGATWVMSWPLRLDDVKGAARFAARRYARTDSERVAG